MTRFALGMVTGVLLFVAWVLVPDERLGFFVVHHGEGSTLRFAVRQMFLDELVPGRALVPAASKRCERVPDHQGSPASSSVRSVSASGWNGGSTNAKLVRAGSAMGMAIAPSSSSLITFATGISGG